MDQALDSAGLITPKAARAAREAGKVGWLRYHYNLTADEVRAAHDEGLWVSLIGEFDTTTWHPPVHNPELGTDHAIAATSVARRLGFPGGSVIWFTADT